MPHQQPLVEDMLPPCLVNSLPPEKASHGTVPKARIGPSEMVLHHIIMLEPFVGLNGLKDRKSGKIHDVDTSNLCLAVLLGFFLKSTPDDAPRRIDSANRRRCSFAGTKRWCVTHWKACHVNVSCHRDKCREKEDSVWGCIFIYCNNRNIYWVISCYVSDQLSTGLVTCFCARPLTILEVWWLFRFQPCYFGAVYMGMLVSQFRDINQWCFPTAPGILC